MLSPDLRHRFMPSALHPRYTFASKRLYRRIAANGSEIKT